MPKSRGRKKKQRRPGPPREATPPIDARLMYELPRLHHCPGPGLASASHDRLLDCIPFTGAVMTVGARSYTLSQRKLRFCLEIQRAVL